MWWAVSTAGDDFCGLVSGGALLLGKTPYEPKVFWIGWRRWSPVC